MKRDATRILTRSEENPILDVKDYPGIAQLYNPTVVRHNGEYIMLVSTVEHAAPLSHGGTVAIGTTKIARSKNGIKFELDYKDFISFDSVPKEWHNSKIYSHFIDNRVTKIGDTYYIITPVCVDGGFQGPVGMLGKTKDFKKYEAIDIITAPTNRGASLFPEKINGRYYKLDRPGAGPNRGDIWISASPDLTHWGEFKPVIAPGYRFWNESKMGPTPPIKTDKGWLVIVHGVWKPAGGTQYYVGAMLLDLVEPWKVIGKTNSYILGPDMPYEQHGTSDNSPFPCGAIGDVETDEFILYYGACDKYICRADGKLSEVVQACIDGI